MENKASIGRLSDVRRRQTEITGSELSATGSDASSISTTSAPARVETYLPRLDRTRDGLPALDDHQPMSAMERNALRPELAEPAR